MGPDSPVSETNSSMSKKDVIDNDADDMDVDKSEDGSANKECSMAGDSTDIELG